MYPKAPQLFPGQGATDDPVTESYWKAANGIRLTGMPAFKTKLTDTQLWQVSQLLAHANEIVRFGETGARNGRYDACSGFGIRSEYER